MNRVKPLTVYWATTTFGGFILKRTTDGPVWEKGNTMQSIQTGLNSPIVFSSFVVGLTVCVVGNGVDVLLDCVTTGVDAAVLFYSRKRN
jgi:hypothetical protein